jgi:hypothetical protein
MKWARSGSSSQEARHINRFGIEVVAACGNRFFPIAAHGIRREGNDGNTLRCRVGLEPPCR